MHIYVAVAILFSLLGCAKQSPLEFATPTATKLEKAENKPPVVDAGVDQSILQSVVKLTAAATDSDGTIAFVVWSQVSGPNSAVMSGQNTTTLEVSGLIPGNYTFQVIAEDNSGAQAADVVDIIVNAAGNNPPVVDAGSNQTLNFPEDTISLTGNASDSDGIASYLWSQVSGPTLAKLVDTTTTTLNASLLVAGTYVFQLSATDKKGAIGLDSVTVVVKPVTYQWLSQNVLGPKCASCHGGSSPDGNYSVDTYSGTMKYVKANNASSSKLYSAVLNNSMPKRAPALSNANKDAIKVWINSGALNN